MFLFITIGRSVHMRPPPRQVQGQHMPGGDFEAPQAPSEPHGLVCESPSA